MWVAFNNVIRLWVNLWSNNFCPNCGYCLKPNAFHQRIDMPPPPPPCRCCIEKDCPYKKDCDKKLENHKGRRHFLRKPEIK